MNGPTVIWGIGQMGATFAHGLLRTGHTIHPITRQTRVAQLAEQVPEPRLVLVAVGEADLEAVLNQMPTPWRDRVALLQNELLPCDWERDGFDSVTVAVVWFEKKRSKPLHPILSTPIAGPAAQTMVEALRTLELPAAEVDSAQLVHELVKKNLYILTANIAGLEVGGTTGSLWRDHHELTRSVALEVLAIQAWRAKASLDEETLLQGLSEALLADPEHGCRGRSAPARLRRALDHAREASLETPILRGIASRLDD